MSFLILTNLLASCLQTSSQRFESLTLFPLILQFFFPFLFLFLFLSCLFIYLFRLDQHHSPVGWFSLVPYISLKRCAASPALSVYAKRLEVNSVSAQSMMMDIFVEKHALLCFVWLKKLGRYYPLQRSSE